MNRKWTCVIWRLLWSVLCGKVTPAVLKLNSPFQILAAVVGFLVMRGSLFKTSRHQTPGRSDHQTSCFLLVGVPRFVLEFIWYYVKYVTLPIPRCLQGTLLPLNIPLQRQQALCELVLVRLWGLYFEKPRCQFLVFPQGVATCRCPVFVFCFLSPYINRSIDWLRWDNLLMTFLQIIPVRSHDCSHGTRRHKEPSRSLTVYKSLWKMSWKILKFKKTKWCSILYWIR